MNEAIDAVLSLHVLPLSLIGAVLGCGLYIATHKKRPAAVSFGLVPLHAAGTAAAVLLLSLHLTVCVCWPNHLVELWDGQTRIHAEDVHVKDMHAPNGHRQAAFNMKLGELHGYHIGLESIVIAITSAFSLYVICWKGKFAHK